MQANSSVVAKTPKSKKAIVQETKKMLAIVLHCVKSVDLGLICWLQPPSFRCVKVPTSSVTKNFATVLVTLKNE